MKIKIIIVIAIGSMTLIIQNVYGQNKLLQEVHVGEHIPDIEISGFYKDTSRKVLLSTLYQHKLLLLDFWATWCGGCLEEMPKFNNLKKEFGDKIQIVAVGYEKYSRIAALFKRNPALNSDSYLTLTKDSILSRQLFPHKLLPHIAWIDSTGKVIMISDGEDITSENIKLALASKPLPIIVKKDISNFSPDDMFKPFTLMDTSYMDRSILTKSVNGMISFDGGLQGNSKGDPKKFNRFFEGNITIYDLYRFAAYRNTISGQNNSTTIFEVKDSLKYFDPSYDPVTFQHSQYKNKTEWYMENCYIYDLKVHIKVPDTILSQYMIQDLNRYFHLNGRFEKREMNCYVLRKLGQLVKSYDTSSGNARLDTLLSPISINIEELLKTLNNNIIYGAIINESNVPLDQLFNFNWNIHFGTTPEMINTYLKRYGLQISKGQGKVKVFVLSEY